MKFTDYLTEKRETLSSAAKRYAAKMKNDHELARWIYDCEFFPSTKARMFVRQNKALKQWGCDTANLLIGLRLTLKTPEKYKGDDAFIKDTGGVFDIALTFEYFVKDVEPTLSAFCALADGNYIDEFSTQRVTEFFNALLNGELDGIQTSSPLQYGSAKAIHKKLSLLIAKYITNKPKATDPLSLPQQLIRSSSELNNWLEVRSIDHLDGEDYSEFTVLKGNVVMAGITLKDASENSPNPYSPEQSDAFYVLQNQAIEENCSYLGALPVFMLKDDSGNVIMDTDFARGQYKKFNVIIEPQAFYKSAVYKQMLDAFETS